MDASGGRKVFIFDRVFGEDVDQDGVFDYVSDSIHSFVQGYNVSVLAYGQSGAGKSYTMGTTGPREQEDADIMGMLKTEAAALGPTWCANRTIRYNPPRCSTALRETRRDQQSSFWLGYPCPGTLVRLAQPV